MSDRRRVALLGASFRGMYAFARPLAEDYADTHELVGVLEPNPNRRAALRQLLGRDLPTFEDLSDLHEQARPDIAVIATIDAVHAEQVTWALEHGIEVVCEKPLCIDSEQCRAIRAAARANPNVRAMTAHNYRYEPAPSRIKALIDEGRIGDIRSIIFHEVLDRRHGASYFRRWNRSKKLSGGLLVHKGSHIFDLLNWWVGARPTRVAATGSLTAYGPDASPFHGERCCTCPHAAECPEYVDLSRDDLRGQVYFQSREPKRYTPDLCVFDPAIDSEDHTNVIYRYDNGVEVTFDLCAYASYEGVDVMIEGSKGRLEYIHRHSTRPLAESGEHGTEIPTEDRLTIQYFERPIETIDLPQLEGSHGGADPAMLRDLFGSNQPSGAQASLEDGIQAVGIGVAANRSIAEGRFVHVQDMLDETG